MRSNRFSKQALTRRYLKNKHGYLLMGTLFVSIHAYVDGPHDISGSHSLRYRRLAGLLEPLFGGYSYAGFFFIISVLLIFYIELVVFNSNENKESQK